MDYELTRLDSLVSAENQSLGFMTGAGGAFFGLAASLAAGVGLSPMRLAVLVALTAVAGVTTLWSGIVWHRTRKDRPNLLREIREFSRTDEPPV